MSLLSICKRRIIEEVILPVRAISASGGDGYLAMVVDGFTLKVISSCCSFYDIIEAGVTIVEQLHSKRQPLRRMDCIYFVTYDKKNLEAIQRDFEGEEMYRSAHLFVTGFRGERASAFEILSDKEGLLRRLLSFKEVNLDFIPYDSRTFYVDTKGTFANSVDLLEAQRYAILSAISTLCKTIGIQTKPVIRYQNFGRAEVISSCRELAGRLSNLQSGGSEGSENCTILILDRSFDTAPLYLHDYHYQALAYDLLNIPVTLSGMDYREMGAKTRLDESTGKVPKLDDVYEYEISSSGGNKEKKMAVLDEKDSKWVLYRHEHIGTVNQAITEETLKFTHTDVTAKIHRGDDSAANISTSETIRAVRALPQYQQTLSRYWIHISLIGECYNLLKRDNITAIGEFEQSITTMIDSDGKTVNSSKQRSNINAILNHSNENSEDAVHRRTGTQDTEDEFPVIKNSIDKLRLILLYVSHHTGVSNDDLNQLIELGKLSNDEQVVLKKLLGLGLCGSFEDIASGNGKHIHRFEVANKERVKYFKQRLRNVEISLSRFEPLIKTISYHLLCRLNVGNNSIVSYNSFNQNAFEQDFPPVDSAPAFQKNSTSLLGAFGQLQSQSLSQPKYSLKNKQVIIFVVGSLTFPEIRCIYELLNESNANIYIGGINITTPTQLIGQVLRS
ncbi:Sec1 family protein [Cryptosporidium felis]|nr:Sec1 family protein [Cryptosporidium felis]